MEWVLVILLIMNMALLFLMLLVVAGGITYFKSLTPTTPSVEKTIPKQEYKEEDMAEDDTVPLEQFTPDFKKPMRFVVKEDQDQEMLEEEAIENER